MIIRNGKEIIEINKGKDTCIEVYMGKYLIWQLVRSCFGNGYWVNDMPWLNDDMWRNN
jgi:hypothetical protein